MTSAKDILLRLAIILLLVPAALVIYAQEESKPKRFSIGLNVGINNAWGKKSTSTEGSISTTKITKKYGLSTGMDLNYSLSNHINLNGALSYIQNNYAGNSEAHPVATQEFSEHFSWMELKVVANYAFLKKPVAPFLGFGISYRYLINSKSESTTRFDNGMVSSGESDMTDSRRKPNYLLHFETGVLIHKNLKLGILYSHSLTNTIDKAKPPPGMTYIFGEEDYKLRSLTISVSYSVPIRDL